MTRRDNFQDVGRDSSEQSDRAHKTDREVGGVANRLLADKPNQVNSLAALIAQVQADEYDSNSEADDRLRDAAPVLAAALEDALPFIQKIARLDPALGPMDIHSVVGEARSFLERHKEETK